MSRRKEKSAEAKRLEREAAEIWGRHVSKEKGYALLCAATVACALPMLLGLRLWDQVPEIVQSGLIGLDGKDDVLPRWVVCLGLPGLMSVLNIITHGQLLFNQKRGTMPPKAARLLGRWGFPVISVIFCSGVILEHAAGTALPVTFVTPCVLGFALMLLGAHMIDCPPDARIALRLSCYRDERSRRAVHSFAGYLWLAAGLWLIACAMLGHASFALIALSVLLALAVPVLFGYLGCGKDST